MSPQLAPHLATTRFCCILVGMAGQGLLSGSPQEQSELQSTNLASDLTLAHDHVIRKYDPWIRWATFLSKDKMMPNERHVLNFFIRDLKCGYILEQNFGPLKLVWMLSYNCALKFFGGQLKEIQNPIKNPRKGFCGVPPIFLGGVSSSMQLQTPNFLVFFPATPSRYF